MYSPKIQEDHIPKLYQLAKSKKVKMTDLVNEIIRQFLKKEVEYSVKSSTSSQ